jgi:CDP-6-deoxy-D-xylo-4-hexulose-3-dehydrase
LLKLCKDKNILLIEDVCESHGTTFKGKKVGSFGYASNFSFYFAHHMSTIEGGMVCTNDDKFYQMCRALRSHGMMREMTDDSMKQEIIEKYPDLNPDFIFVGPAHNFRSTEINAVIGLNQLPRLDDNNKKRISNFNHFISNLNAEKYITELRTAGQCNYAFIVIMRDDSLAVRDKIEATLKKEGIEFRRGLSGGGNQMRQPFMTQFNYDLSKYPNIEHIHNFSWYIGNYPSLPKEKIDYLLEVLNNL